MATTSACSWPMPSSRSESTSRWPSTPAPVSTTGPGALTSSSASTKPVIRIPKKHVRRDVRRRHCSRVRWPRFPQLAFGPHPSRHGSESASPQPAPFQKNTFGEAFGAATGVSDPRLQKLRIRNNGAGGKAAAVAGYVGPGFHNWPSGHIPQDTAPNPLLRSRPHAKKRRSERRSAPRPGSATHGYKKSEDKTTAQAAKPPL